MSTEALGGSAEELLQVVVDSLAVQTVVGHELGGLAGDAENVLQADPSDLNRVAFGEKLGDRRSAAGDGDCRIF